MKPPSSLSSSASAATLLSLSSSAASRFEASINAFVARGHDDADALKAAGESDERRRTGRPLSRLDGVPFAAKANFADGGRFGTTCGSRALDSYVSSFSATAVSRLIDAGLIHVGSTNMDEFGMGSHGSHSFHGPTKNPLCASLSPGGSSSGSAAAVAYGGCGVALGSDTGGSVRLPAAWCGVVGIKPTYGRVSRHGLVAYASSLDCPGVLAPTVKDAALALALIAGPDGRDAQCLDDESFGERIDESLVHSDLAGVTVGVPLEFYTEQVEPSVAAAWQSAIDAAQAAGADVRVVSLPSVMHALPAYYVLASAEASSNLARYDGVRYGKGGEGEASPDSSNEWLEQTGDAKAFHRMLCSRRSAFFGKEVHRRLLAGSYVLSKGAAPQFYERAVSLRHHLCREFASAFDSVDAMLAPVAATLPVSSDANDDDDVLQSYATDVMTVPASLAGIPAISVPCGSKVGSSVQVMAAHGDEATMVRVARAVEGC